MYVLSKFEKNVTYKADHFIINFLLTEDEKQFGEIQKHLEKEGITYANNKGLDLKLKSLIKRKIIYKRFIPGKRPLYGFQKKALADIGIQAMLFAREAGNKLFSSITVPPNEKSKTTDYLEEMVQKAGVYFVFNFIQSHKLAETITSDDDKNYVKDTWMEKVLSMISIQHFFTMGLVNMLQIEQEKEEKKYCRSRDVVIRGVLGNSEKEIENIEKKLLKLFPKEAKICKGVVDNLEKILRDQKSFLQKRGSILRKYRIEHEKQKAKRERIRKRLKISV